MGAKEPIPPPGDAVNIETLPEDVMGGSDWPGIVTVNNWTMGPDGRTYLYFWCRKWVIITDKMLAHFTNTEKFRSSERWQLVGYGSGRLPQIFIPGCQVKGWTRTPTPPPPNPDKLLIVE